MRDGSTRRLESEEEGRGWSATLVEVAGGAEGNEHPLDRERLTVGRGPGVDIAFGDDLMSCEHAAFEWGRGGVCVVDLDSTNGTKVNGERVAARALAHGDRVEIGRHVFELLLEKREKPLRTWVIDAGD